MDSSYFERTLLADQKRSPVVSVLPQDSTNVFKDTYIFEFLRLPEAYSEKELRKALLQDLEKFILELEMKKSNASYPTVKLTFDQTNIEQWIFKPSSSNYKTPTKPCNFGRALLSIKATPCAIGFLDTTC